MIKFITINPCYWWGEAGINQRFCLRDTVILLERRYSWCWCCGKVVLWTWGCAWGRARWYWVLGKIGVTFGEGVEVLWEDEFMYDEDDEDGYEDHILAGHSWYWLEMLRFNDYIYRNQSFHIRPIIHPSYYEQHHLSHIYSYLISIASPYL